MCTLFNIGCKLNQYEGYCLQKKFAKDASIFIVNTCCVTEQAAQKSRKKFHQVLKKYPSSTVVVTGCACVLHPDEYAQAHQIIGAPERSRLIENIFPLPPRSRYFLKIQDGCTEPCTYCIVSIIRKTLSSKPIDRIIDEVAWAQKNAYHEIVLVGANIGLYGMDSGKSLERLLAKLTTVKQLPRIRLSSIEPRFITTSLITVMKDLPVCRHFHVPIQSGDDTILSNMGRPYMNRDLRKRINELAHSFSDAAIGIDVIVGFPGEDNGRFLNTQNLIRDLPITHAHVFPYSPRPGTKVYNQGNPVPPQKKKERLWILKHLVADKNLQFRQHIIGREFETIVVRSKPKCIGLTDNYVSVELDHSLGRGTVAQVKIVMADPSLTKGIITTPRN